MTAWTRPNAEPNVTPMIDVLLVLLIVFMFVVVQGRRTIDVQLPEECAANCGASDAIVLEVMGAQGYRLNQRPVTHDALLAVLTDVSWPAGQDPVGDRPIGRELRTGHDGDGRRALGRCARDQRSAEGFLTPLTARLSM